MLTNVTISLGIEYGKYLDCLFRNLSFVLGAHVQICRALVSARSPEKALMFFVRSREDLTLARSEGGRRGYG